MRVGHIGVQPILDLQSRVLGLQFRGVLLTLKYVSLKYPLGKMSISGGAGPHVISIMQYNRVSPAKRVFGKQEAGIFNTLKYVSLKYPLEGSLVLGCGGWGLGAHQASAGFLAAERLCCTGIRWGEGTEPPPAPVPAPAPTVASGKSR